MTNPDQTFTSSDKVMFGRFGVALDLLVEAGVQRVNDDEARAYLASNHRGDLAGLWFPYLDPETGKRVTGRLRRDHPEVDANGKPDKKYLAPYGDPPHLYFGPGAGAVLADVTVPAVLAESEKAALTLVAASRRAKRPMLGIALGGCHGWHTSRAGKTVDASGARVNVSGPQPDLARVTWPGRDTILLFDSNAATNGKVRLTRRHLTEELTKRGARVRIGTVPLEDGTNGPDDYRAVHDDAALLKLIGDAVPAQPATVDELLEECGVLALPKPTDASQAEPVIRAVRDALRGADALRTSAVRSKLAALLRDRGIGDAAKLVDAAIGVVATDSDGSDVPFLADVEPWPDPVDGATVLSGAVVLLRKYVVLPSHAAEAIALWTLHAFLMNCWNTSPILAVLSPVKRCGKSLCMEVVQALVPRGLLVSNLSTSSLFRVVEAFGPTLLSDEADTWLSDDTSELRGIFNSGWRRGTAKVLRCDGDEHTPTLFSTWAPKAIAAIGKLPNTIEDRSIVVGLRRKTAGERVARYRHDRVEVEALPLRRQLRRWADDHADDLGRLDPDDLEALNDRAADNWRPLRALALAVGGEWPARADAAALALSGVADEADENVGVLLLGDTRIIFTARGATAISSADLTAALVALPDRPWSEWSGGRSMTAVKLAARLRPFDLRTRKVRDGARTVNTYLRSDFLDAWTRYLSPEHGFNSEQAEQPNEYGVKPPVFNSEQNASVPSPENAISSMFTESVPSVPTENPDPGTAAPFEEV